MTAILRTTAIALLGAGFTLSATAADQGMVQVPQRGLTKAKVEAVFGAPQQTMAPVGQPPITRWRYADKTIYFEYDLVLHTVVDPAPE